MKVIIVGAGLAGLTCAKVFSQRNSEIAIRRLGDGDWVRIDENCSILSGEKAAREVLG